MSTHIEVGFELGTTPLKSGMRQQADEFHFDENGLFEDREYMFVEAEGRQPGKFLSQRADGTLALVQSELRGGGIRLNHPDMPASITIGRESENEENIVPVTVHKWEGLGIDQGERAAQWGQDLMGRAVRLVRISDRNPRFVENNPHLGKVGFSDGYPLLVLGRGSVKAISEFMQDQSSSPIEARNFGPNILLDSDEPFIEDRITSMTFGSDDLVWELARRKACGRCKMPSRKPEDGEMRKGITVLDALVQMGRKGTHTNTKAFGKRPERFFGQNFVIKPSPDLEPRHMGILRASTKMVAHVSDSTNWTATA